MWVFARYWFGLTLEEFGELTPKDFWDLWQQRQVEFKRNCYLQGITASMIAAAHGAENITPFDFIGKTAEEVQRDAIVRTLQKTHNELQRVFPERLPQARISCLANLQSRGIPNAEKIIEEVFGE
jgi:hypothetical protein